MSLKPVGYSHSNSPVFLFCSLGLIVGRSSRVFSVDLFVKSPASYRLACVGNLVGDIGLIVGRAYGVFSVELPVKPPEYPWSVSFELPWSILHVSIVCGKGKSEMQLPRKQEELAG